MIQCMTVKVISRYGNSLVQMQTFLITCRNKSPFQCQIDTITGIKIIFFNRSRGKAKAFKGVIYSMCNRFNCISQSTVQIKYTSFYHQKSFLKKLKVRAHTGTFCFSLSISRGGLWLQDRIFSIILVLAAVLTRILEK